jgi:phosphopantothenoylcysteine synthetase/decarboxylase
VIVTAGGTIEPIDSASLTNRVPENGNSHCRECYRHGAGVLLVISAHPQCLAFSTNKLQALKPRIHSKNNVQSFNYIIHAAAVSDFTTTKIDDKLDSANSCILHLPTHKIINEIKWNLL